MTIATLPGSGPAQRKPVAANLRPAVTAEAGVPSIPASFQLVIGLYIILKGAFPAILQAVAFGLDGGAETEFAAAMITQIFVDILLILPLLLLSRHPLGILHPLILAIVAWPLLRDMPRVIEDWGGWAGILAGTRVTAPFFTGLPTRAASGVWDAIATYNLIHALALICAYAGFWLLKSKGQPVRLPSVIRNSTSVRTVMIALIGLSLVLLAFFVRSRGGIDAHLTSLGGGRFKELSELGPVIVAIDLGAIALYVWIANNPSEIKSPVFVAVAATVAAGMFLTNGTRGGALEVLMIVGLIWALRRQTVPWKIALLLIPFMFLSIGLLGAIRTASWTRSTASQTFSQTGWSASFALAQQEVQERNAASASVPVVARGLDLSDGPLLGTSYAGALAAFIPRTIWPGKPRGVGSLYAQLFLGASKSGTTIPVEPEAEMYWNFGIPGVILLSILYGALLRVAYNFYWRRYPNPFAVVFYVFVITRFQFSSDWLVGLEQRLFLLAICYALIAMLVPANERVENPLLRQPNRVLRNSET